MTQADCDFMRGMMQLNTNMGERASVSLGRLFVTFRWAILATWFLVMMEAALMLLFPLAIGIAIDGMIRQTFVGLYILGGLGVLTVVAGAVRRFYDTRVYSKIYVASGRRITRQQRNRSANVSVISARTNMASELVDFFETSFPGIIDCAIGLAGAILMIWWLQASVCAACLFATGLIAAIYVATSRATYSLNQNVNHESEKQVQILAEGRMSEVSAHFVRLMRWNIRLSDLETINYALSWIVMIGLLMYAVTATVQGGANSYGTVLSVLMYVFGYIERVIAVPLYYQQFLRLHEISHRLAGVPQ